MTQALTALIVAAGVMALAKVIIRLSEWVRDFWEDWE